MLTDYCIASSLKLLASKFDSSLCKSDTNLVYGVHVLERPARTNRNASPLRGSASRFARGGSFQYMNTENEVSILYIPSVQKFAFECPSVRLRFVSALYLEHSSNFVYE